MSAIHWWCGTYGVGGNHYGTEVTVSAGQCNSSSEAPVINNQAEVVTIFSETMPGVMYQVMKLLSLFSSLIYTDSSTRSVNTMKLTFTQSMHLDFRTKQRFKKKNLSSK